MIVEKSYKNKTHGDRTAFVREISGGLSYSTALQRQLRLSGGYRA